jgi:hypothetical protein
MGENVIFLVAGKAPMQGRAAFERGLRLLLAGHALHSSGDVLEVEVSGREPARALGRGPRVECLFHLGLHP